MSQRILELGIESKKNIGDLSITNEQDFYKDAFYIKFFSTTFPNMDYSNLGDSWTNNQNAINI